MEDQKKIFLVAVVYYCRYCQNPKPRYRKSWETGNTDYRQYCWRCAMITEHTAPVMDTIKASE
ncbi:MAG TPA: hypothetical protein VL576_02125 [Candidatus Paceibacterota bacterium]|nr:hypothetical protein [Candidatus Paceibacterota bacterium]